MSFLTWLRNSPNTAGVVPNDNPGTSVGLPDYNPGDPDGLELDGFDEPPSNRSLPWASPSPWSGWPEQWSTPDFARARQGINKLIDIAWTCIDKKTKIISSMPVYRTVDGDIVQPIEWMTNPDPDIYTCWQEFAKQLFWDYQLGEAFVMPMTNYADGYPARFRVIPPWLVNVELNGTTRSYNIGSNDVTDRILHIRYHSTTTDARGHGPLEVAGAKLTTIGLLQRYVNNLAESGGIPQYWLELTRKMNKSEATDVLTNWIETRAKFAGHPAIVSDGAKLNQSHSMNARDMSLMELSQFNESRIAVLLGMPPFLVGLAGATGSLTYSNISDLFDFHDRSDVRPDVNMVMNSLSNWALPRGQSAELNRDDYTRLPIDKRYAAYAVGIQAGFLTPEMVQDMERLTSQKSAQALTGGAD